MTPEDRIAELEADVAQQREQIADAAGARAGAGSAAGQGQPQQRQTALAVTGWGARRRACARRAARSRVGSWGIAARRCSWWRRRTRWWSIGQRSACSCQTPLARTRRWCCASGGRCTTCRRCGCGSRSIRRCTCAVPRCAAGQCGRLPRRGAEPGAVWAAAAGVGGLSGRAATRALCAGARTARRPVRRARLAGHAGALGAAGGRRRWSRSKTQIKAALRRSAGAAQRRDRRAPRRDAGLGACGQHEPPDALRHPRQARAARRPTPLASCPPSAA